jgi:aminopeptidase N
MQPIGTRADLYQDFTTYNNAVYTRAQLMYQALNDVMGVDAFRKFLRDYFARWEFHHVDRWAMQGAAERAFGGNLEWFFDQWITEIGTIDYVLRSPTVKKDADGYLTTVRLERAGTYRHPMPVGVRTESGWTIVRGSVAPDVQELNIRTHDEPNAVWLDPFGTTDDENSRFYRIVLSGRK